MKANTALKVTPETPLLLRRIQQKPQVQHPMASGHMTVVTTQGFKVEMNDQQEDATRYDQD
jgi:hypothetical protein